MDTRSEVFPMSTQWRAWLGGAVLGGGLVGAFLRISEAPPEFNPPLHAVSPAVPEIQAELDREKARANDLARELVRVEEEFMAWRAVEEPELEPEPLGVSPEQGLDAGSSEEEASPEPWFDAQGLIDLGFSQGEVEHIREVWEDYLMRKLKIQNQRARRGKDWAADEMGRWMWANQQNAREELGDQGYEAMLYAGGERNRVTLSELLESSPAVAAGLVDGDQVVAYGDRRIFSPSELKRSISGVALGEWVEVRVLRDGELRRFFVESGPLGARMEFESLPPYQLR